jgi:hypothetical protein
LFETSTTLIFLSHHIFFLLFSAQTRMVYHTVEKFRWHNDKLMLFTIFAIFTMYGTHILPLISSWSSHQRFLLFSETPIWPVCLNTKIRKILSGLGVLTWDCWNWMLSEGKP